MYDFPKTICKQLFFNALVCLSIKVPHLSKFPMLKMINLCPSAWNKTVIISVYYTIHTLSHIPNLKEHLPKKRKIFVSNHPICVV